MVGDDLSQLILDIVGIDWLPADFGQSLGGSFELALLDKVSWRFGEDEEADGQYDSPKKLNSDWDTVRAGIVAVLSCVDHTVGQEDTDGDTELVSCHDSTTNSFRCDFLESLSKSLGQDCKRRGA